MKKYSRQISVDTLKSLLARSGNQCAFPDCIHPLFDDNNLFIAQLCHIEGVSPLGQRHNPDKSSEETNSYDNLLFLCYRHHKESDNVDLFPVKRLKEIKESHETKFKEATYKYSNEVLMKLINETNSYWGLIEELQTKHLIPDFAIPIDIKVDILTLLSEVNSNLQALNEISIVLMNECKSTHFEYVCLALPNLLGRIDVAFHQIEIKYLEELVLKNPNSNDLKAKLNQLRNIFSRIAQTAALAD